MADIAIGIDLGTSNSVVAVLEGGRPKVIPNEWGEVIHPSIVHFEQDGSVTVGSRSLVKNSQSIITLGTAPSRTSVRLCGSSLARVATQCRHHERNTT